MAASSYVLIDKDGRLHLYTIDEDDQLDIPEGWSYLPGPDAEARFWAQGASAVEEYEAKVSRLRAEQVTSDMSNEGRLASVQSLESRLGLDTGTLTSALPLIPEWPDKG